MAETRLAGRLQKRIVTYSAIGIFVVGTAAALVAMVPLYHQLTKAVEAHLLFEARTRALAVEQYLLRTQDIAMQITSRTKAREELQSLLRGEVTREEFLAFTRPILTDALNKTDEVVGITRLDPAGEPIAAVGEPISQRLRPIPESTSRQAVLRGPVSVEGEDRLVVGAPILNRRFERVGTDVVLFKVDPLERMVRDYTGLKETGESILGHVTGEGVRIFFAPRRASIPHDRALPAGSALARAVANGAGQKQGILSSGEDGDRAAVIAYGPVAGVPWGLVVRMDKREVYADVRGQAYTMAGVLLAFIALGTFGMVCLLRPLTGRILLHADELQEQIDGKTAALQDELGERHHAEAELRRTAEELARSNEELEQFAYVASHDLQEPLRMVSSYVQLLARRYRGKLDSDADEFIHFAEDGATRMQTLINDLLAYSRVRTRGHEFEPTDSRAVLDVVLVNLQERIRESGAEVTCGELPVVLADRTQLGQLLQNLVGNALKYRRDAAPRVHVSAEPDGSLWRFAVRDNGIGIETEYLERIFVIFQRLHGRGEYPGTGIGLAVCKKIVERHGGRIWVESTPGEGSTFYFTLPEREADDHA